MPLVSRCFIRGALLYLLVGLMMQSAQTAGLYSALRITSIHAIWAGGLTQLAAGVALWMLPQPRPSATGLTRLAWVAFGGLHVGLLLRLIAEPWPLSSLSASALKLSALAQLGGAWALVLSLWPRTYPRR